MKKILILNGPNLNMLGIREPEIYGSSTLQDVENLCNNTAETLNLSIDFRQSNHEGELIEWIQEARNTFDGLVFNAAAYTHTSVAIHDALKLLDYPIIEVHITDPKTREVFRHHSYIQSVAQSCFSGHGIAGYKMALENIAELLR